VMPALHAAYTVSEVSLASLTDPTVGGHVSVTYSGGVTGALLPTFACAKVNFHTGLRGRSYRGRTGLCGIPEDYTDSLTPNTLKPTPRSNLDTAMNDFIVAANTDLVLIGTGYTLAVVSQVHNGLDRNPPIATQITVADVAAALGTRRNRM